MKANENRVVVVLSGGQDSTTCLFAMRNNGYEVHAVTFDYNQRHRAEIEAARIVAKLADVASHEVIEMGAILKGTSPLVSDNDLEQYEDEYSLPGGLEKTFVPMRNQLFLTIAANRAYCLGTNTVVTGVCEEDYGGYPDCRRTFIASLEFASSLGTFTGEEDTLPRLRIITPLMKMSKRETVLFAMSEKECYGALSFSHTAYDGQFPPNGKDHATLLRAKGFLEANIPDPLILRAYLQGAIDELPDSQNYKVRLQPYVDKVEEAMWRVQVFNHV